jgi:rSAM/selenodomain-associated transferase 2
LVSRPQSEKPSDRSAVGVRFDITSVPRVSVVIPVYRDGAALARLLGSQSLAGTEVIVSTARGDADVQMPVMPSTSSVMWVEGERGRARQMNTGAAAATGDWLLFLHADTDLPLRWRDAIAAADRSANVVNGCFRFALDATGIAARAIECGVRARVALFGLPYGDQALFVRRDVFREIGGYRDLPIMEDVDLVRRLRRRGRMFSSPLTAVTSARRWEREGWTRRTGANLLLILLYFAGVAPANLARLDRRKYI